MSLLTNFQNKQDKIAKANTIAENIINHKLLPIRSNLLYELNDLTLFSSKIIDTGISQASISSEYTIFITINPYSWSNYKGVMGYHGGNNQGLVGLQYEGGSIKWSHIGSGGYINLSSYIGTTNKKYNLIFTFKDEKISVYLNGNKIITDFASSNISAYGNIIIGRAYNASDRYFYGQIGKCYIYNRALNDTELEYMNKYITQ